MKVGKLRQVLIGVFLLVMFAFSLQAQVFVPQNMMSNPVLQRAMENHNMTTTAISGLIRNDMLRNSAKGSKKQGSGGKSQPKQLVAVGPTSFKAATANSIVKTLASQMGGNLIEQRQAEDFFNACIDRYFAVVKKDGFPINDLASGFLYYILNNYSVYHNVFEKYNYPDEVIKHPYYTKMSGEIGIYQQFRRLLASSEDIKKITDKEKQQFTEMLAIMTRATFQLYETGLRNSDHEMVKRAQKMAKENLQTLFQVSPDKVVINEEGVSLMN